MVGLWDEVVHWTKRWPNEEVCRKLFWELCHKLLHLFGKDHEHEYGDVMRQHAEGNVGNSEYFDDWSGDAIAEFFQKRTRKILRSHIKGVCGYEYVREWLDNMDCHEKDFEQWGSSALQPVPYMTLRFKFDLPEWPGWDYEGDHVDDSGSDDETNAFT